VNSELRRAIRSTRPTDPSLDLALQAATGPKLVQWITVFVGVGLVAFVAAVVSYRRLHKPIERPKATPEITINLDQPLTPLPSISPTVKRKHRLTKPSKTQPQPETANQQSPQSPSPTATGTGTQTTTPTGTGTGSGSGSGSAQSGTVPGAGAVQTQIPDDLPDEESPPTEQDLAERAKAAAYADNIRFVLKAHRAQVVSCYERAFKEDGTSPGGKVIVDFAVGTDGRAHKIQTSANSTGKEQLSKCLEQRLGEWEFPKPGEEFATSFPFVFSAGG